jgi:hypothetical protein
MVAVQPQYVAIVMLVSNDEYNTNWQNGSQ